MCTRIRSDRQNNHVGVNRQEGLCRRFAQSKGLAVVAVEQDNDVSALKTAPRSRRIRLLTLVQANEIDGIVVWHTDRLYCRIADLGMFVNPVNARGLKISSVIAGDLDLTNASGILICCTVW